MLLAISGVLFAIFAINVVLGATAGAAFLGDVGEFLLLLCFSIVFVTAILRAEKVAENSKTE